MVAGETTAHGKAAPPNKGMKQTSVEHTERSQLIPGVGPTDPGE
jgi:hypothetical protein